MADIGDGLATGSDLVVAAEAAVGRALARIGGRRPDLLCVFVCGADPDGIARASAAAARLAEAGTAIGCSAGGVIGGGRGVEQRPSVAAWAAVLPGVTVSPVHLTAHRAGDRTLVSGLLSDEAGGRVGVLLADPYGFPIAPVVAQGNTARPGLPLVGGLASGPGGPGAPRLFLDGEVVEGAVGVLLDGPVSVRVAVSQGCRPIGPDMTVTRAEGTHLLELAGQPAYARLEQIIHDLGPAERDLALRGLQLGIAMDEYAEEHGRGDFLIRGVLGADPRSGAVAVGDAVEVGTCVRFQVRDAASADEELAATLAGVGPDGAGDGALLFSCNGRGRAMFPSADHDVETVRRTLGLEAVAGFFAAGEIGPVGGRNHVHAFTASILTVGAEAAGAP